LLLALVPLFGCGPLQSRDLKDVQIEKLLFITHTQAQWIKLEPVYQPKVCPRLANAKVHINGTAAVADSLGDYDAPLLPGEPGRCVDPEWRLEGPPPGDVTSATATIADRSATLTVTAENPYAERRMTLVSPVDRQIRRGEEVVLRWSVPTDVLTSNTAYFTPEGGQAPFNVDAPVIEGDLVRVRIPANAALGRGVLHPIIDGRPRVTRCEGVQTCEVEAIIENDIWSQQMEIIP
jgi:hypothetical protein